ncbi:hypothetical protein HK102_014200 [Quaeritorhiza haematococci]|nr:hypothetical protein HK102_014200 [Quaeritorhiza haematococci]
MFGSDMMKSQVGPDGKAHVKLDPDVDQTTFTILMEFLYNGYLKDQMQGDDSKDAEPSGNANDGNKDTYAKDLSKEEKKDRAFQYHPVAKCSANSKDCRASTTFSRLYRLPVKMLIQLAYLSDRYLHTALTNLCEMVLKIHLSNVTLSKKRLPIEDILSLAFKLNLKGLMDQFILGLTQFELMTEGKAGTLAIRLAKKGEYELLAMVFNKVVIPHPIFESLSKRNATKFLHFDPSKNTHTMCTDHTGAEQA